MMHRGKQLLHTSKNGVARAVAVALAFFLFGVFTVADVHWSRVSEAGSTPPRAQESPTGRTMPSSFADLAQKLSPSVVNIKVTKVAKVAGWQGPQQPEGPFGELFKRFFQGLPQRPEQFKQQGTGSGVIIDAGGTILTNHHVVADAEEVMVTLANQQEYKAQVVGRDPKTDLAVLKITVTESLTVAGLGDSDALQVGDWVLAIGNPFGLSHTVTSGIVSAKGRVIGAGPYDDFIQTDASINPGNSGGPLFNMQGEVIGINTAILPHGQGIGFAIPVNTAKPLIPQLVSKGEVTRGYLGVSIQSIDPELAKALKLRDRQGALVGDVTSESPAAQAGIQRGDVIVAFDNTTVDSAQNLPALVAKTPVGQKVTVIVLRDGVQHQLAVTIGKLPSAEARVEESMPSTQSKWGLQLQDITPSMAAQRGLPAEHGVLVVGVEPGSPAEQAGVRQGDLLLEVNRQPVTSVHEAKDVLTRTNTPAPLLLLVKRGAGSLFIAMAK
jgi:serine protease Do